MKKSILIFFGLPLLGISYLPAATVATVATYDAATNANTVDATAPGSATSLGTFTTSVSTAFGLGFGGVASFDSGTFSAQPTLELTYAGGAKTLNITTGGLSMNTSTLDSNSSASALSGSNVLNRATGASADTTFTFASITNGATDEFVTEFAFTILARNTYTTNGSSGGPAEPKTFTATAYFSDGTSAVASDVISQAKGADDTFYSFAAPAGHSIMRVEVDAATNGTTSRYQPLFDDVAFITTAGVIPEPSSLLLIAATTGASLLRRRRN